MKRTVAASLFLVASTALGNAQIAVIDGANLDVARENAENTNSIMKSNDDILEKSREIDPPDSPAARTVCRSAPPSGSRSRCCRGRRCGIPAGARNRAPPRPARLASCSGPAGWSPSPRRRCCPPPPASRSGRLPSRPATGRRRSISTCRTRGRSSSPSSSWRWRSTRSRVWCAG